MAVAPNVVLDAPTWIGQRESSWLFEVLDSQLQLIGQVQPHGSVSISANVGSAVMRTLDGFTMDAQAFSEINPFSDRIRPSMVLGDGSTWPCGVYVFSNTTVARNTYVNQVGATLVDQGTVIDSAFTSAFSVPPLGSIVDAITAICDQSLVINRDLPSENDARVLGAIAFPSGSSKWTALTQLCTLAGFLPPYFDNVGTLVVRLPTPFGNFSADINYASEDSRVLAATISQNDNQLAAPNVYVVTASDAASGEITARASVSAYLPFSLENRGYPITDVLQLQGVYSTTAAQKIADQRAASASGGFLNVEFDAFPDPRHDLFMVVGWDGQLYRETGFTLPFSPGGPMHHTLTQGGYSSG